MKTYILINKDKILEVMAAQFIDCNVQGILLYRAFPYFDESKVCIQLILNNYDKDSLVRLDKNTYYMLSGISLEIRKYKIYVRSDESKKKLLNMLDLYREIKFLDNLQIDVCTNIINNSDEKKLEELNIPEHIREYENVKSSIYNSIKGLISGMLYNNVSFKNNLINNYPIFFSDYTSIVNLKEHLMNQNVKDRKLMRQINDVETAIGEKCIEATRKLYKHNLIFEMNQKKKVCFNREIFNSSEREVMLYDKLINALFIYDKKQSPKERLKKAISKLAKYVEENDTDKMITDDMHTLLMRLREEDFNVSVDDIKTNLVKNLFALVIKIENFKELIIFLSEKKIPDPNMALGAYGMCVGYDNLPNILVEDIQYDFLLSEVFRDNVEYYERVYYDRCFNMILTRYKIDYYTNKFAQIKYPAGEKKLQMNGMDIEIINTNEHTNIKLSDNYIGNLSIIIIPRKTNVSKSIRYFDAKISEIEKLYDNFTYDNTYYFYTKLEKGKIRKIKRIQQEYLFSIILGSVFKFIDKEMCVDER